jgi:hypothetical protein
VVRSEHRHPAAPLPRLDRLGQALERLISRVLVDDVNLAVDAIDF